MSSEDALRFLEAEIETQIEGFDNSRKFYRRGLFYSTVSTASLSALTTVLIGADKALKLGWLSVVALLTSAGVTVVAAWDGFFRYRELWIQKTDAWMQLSKLQSNIKFAKVSKGEVLADDEVEKFYRRFEDILMGEHESWKKVRATNAVAASVNRRSR